MNAEVYEEGEFEYESEGEGEAEGEADEGWGASGEGDEGDEGDEADEADEAGEADEGDESSTIGAMEADEADEGDEADEAVWSPSARLRVIQDQNRRAQWTQQLASDHRQDVQRANAAQRAIQDRIRAIPIQRSARVAAVGSLQGAGVVTAILPNGRRTRMRILPTVAPISEVNRLRSVVIANEKRQAAAIATNAKAVTSLAGVQTSALKRLTAQQLKSDKDLSRRVAQGDNRLDARITKELSGGSGIIERYSKKMVRVARRERRRQVMNSVLVATSVPFFLAYGDRKSPFTVDNAIITGSTLGFLLGDDVISSFAGEKGVMQGLASAWSYGAPALNAGTLWLIFRNKQNQRFVAGITTIPTSGTSAPVDVAALLKSKGVKNFNNSKHSIVASVVGTGGPAVAIQATLSGDGKLTLSTPAGSLPNQVDVGWIIDTNPAAGATS